MPPMAGKGLSSDTAMKMVGVPVGGMEKQRRPLGVAFAFKYE